MLLDVDFQIKKCHEEKKMKYIQQTILLYLQYFAEYLPNPNCCLIQISAGETFAVYMSHCDFAEKNAKFNAGNNFNVNRFRKLHRGRKFNSYLSIE